MKGKCYFRMEAFIKRMGQQALIASSPHNNVIGIHCLAYDALAYYPIISLSILNKHFPAISDETAILFDVQEIYEHSIGSCNFERTLTENVDNPIIQDA